MNLETLLKTVQRPLSQQPPGTSCACVVYVSECLAGSIASRGVRPTLAARRASLQLVWRTASWVYGTRKQSSRHPSMYFFSPRYHATYVCFSAGESLILSNSTHQGPVRGLDFNPIQTNLLSSGAVNGEVSKLKTRGVFYLISWLRFISGI